MATKTGVGEEDDNSRKKEAAVAAETTSTSGGGVAATTTTTTTTSAASEWPTSYEDYEILGKIGRGAFATVYKARCKTTSRECAVKVLDLEHVDTNFIDIRFEVQTMRLSSHANILACFTSFIQQTNLWLVTQLMSKGSSLHCLRLARHEWRRRRKLGQAVDDNEHSVVDDDDDDEDVDSDEFAAWLESHITYILHETLLGLAYIHNNGQIHRDVKAGNILLDEDANVRIADFGVSGWLVHAGTRRDATKTFVGTPCWMAPEVMEQVSGYDYRADIWSLGITALELAMGFAPYAKYPPMKVLLLTIQEDPPSLETYENSIVGPSADKWSKSFRALTKRCLQKDHKQRPTTRELLTNDRHFKPFLEESYRQEARLKAKRELCDLIPNVGSSTSMASSTSDPFKSFPGTAPVAIVTEEDRPAGTTWVFSDGSQVLASSTKHSEEEDSQAFFDEFERSTQGENFTRDAASADADKTLASSNHLTPPSPRVPSEREKEKDDMKDFFDEFESTTGGENFRRNDP